MLKIIGDPMNSGRLDWRANETLAAGKGATFQEFFAIAGDDKKFVWADAKLIGNDKIEVSSDKVAEPASVRGRPNVLPDGRMGKFGCLRAAVAFLPRGGR